MDETLRAKVEDNPDEFLAVLPFGAGSKLYADNPSINISILNFLTSLGIQENPSDLQLAKARWRAKPKGKSDFQTPWTLLLSSFSEDLKTFLLWQQTFTVDQVVTFNVVPFDKSLRSWVIMNVSGDAVRSGDEAKCLALGSIKAALWFNTRFRAVANAALAESKVPSSTDERTLRATESFDLKYIESNDARGDPAPIWQLTGKPLSTNQDLHRAVVEAVRAPKYWLKSHLMEVGKRLVECVWCKADTHPAHACPFPLTLDWAGPKPGTTKRLSRRPTDREESPFPPRGERGGGRGTRGSRGAPRGKGSRPSASGTRLRTSGEGEAPPAGGPLEDGGVEIGGGQVTSDQREQAGSRRTTGSAGDEQWHSTPGADGDLEGPLWATSDGGEEPATGATRTGQRSGNPPPEQTAPLLDRARGSQTVYPGPSEH
ncbi:hypothetical protein C0992_013296 [Termitomyces sp. T32_za158]|nr:hypothetical protein C0992_013296 [Termitomyces sp. T32_za158]